MRSKKSEDKLISDAMKILRRRGGSKPGHARAAALTPERRSEIAKAAAKARWKDKPRRKDDSDGA